MNSSAHLSVIFSRGLGPNDKNSMRESGPSLFGGDLNHGVYQSDVGSEMFIRREKKELVSENSPPLM